MTLLKEAARVARHCVAIKDHTVQGVLARPTLRFMDFVGNAPHGVALPYNYFTPTQWEEAFHECRLVQRENETSAGVLSAVGRRALWTIAALHRTLRRLT